MSAEKCGNTLAFVLPVISTPQDFLLPVSTLSKRAERMLWRIQSKLPTFDPLSEAQVWAKARRLGLTDEE